MSVELKTTPMSFQLEAVEKIEMFEGRALLAMDMGCGKSLTSLIYSVDHHSLRPVVVVCPASVKWHWRNEIRKHIGGYCEVLESLTPYDEKGLWKPNTYWIVNYDILDAWLPFLRSLKPKLAILDEVHYCKSLRTKRTKAVKKLCKKIQHVLALSGTPLTNRPAELFPVLNLLRPDLFPSFPVYATRYCNLRRTPFGIDYSGAKNLDELHRILTKHLMIRYRKRDVLKDLPPKTDQVVVIDVEDRKEYDQAVLDYTGWVRNYKKKYTKQSRTEQRSKIVAVKQVVGRAKLPAVYSWLDSFLENSDEKIIVFGFHREVVEAIQQRYKKLSVMVHGGVVGKKRQEAFDKFSKDKRIRMLSGNVQAAGVGWPGTAASNVVFVEFPWTPGELAQAAARPDRVGQTKPVTCYYLTARDTIEPDLLRLLERKQKILSQTLDGGRRLGDFDIYSKLGKILEGKV